MAFQLKKNEMEGWGMGTFMDVHLKASTGANSIVADVVRCYQMLPDDVKYTCQVYMMFGDDDND